MSLKPITILAALACLTCGRPLKTAESDAGIDTNSIPDAAIDVIARIDAPSCGNGIIEPPEECDDGNTLPWDGCTPSCELEIKDGCVSGLCLPQPRDK